MDEKENIKQYFLSIEDSNIPDVGKYSSLNKNFYEDLNVYQSNKPIAKYRIKPIQFTFEITNKCNCTCPDCGMSANNIKGETKVDNYKLHKIIDELSEIGVMSYAITGGEPFLEFKNMCDMIKYSQNKIDIIKLISNGFWGKNPKFYFDKLIEAGLLNNRFVKPSIYVSIGEQTVDLKNICNLIKYYSENLNDKINFGIINTRFLGQDYSQLEKLYDLYISLYGKFPNQIIYLTDSIYINSNKLKKEKIDTIHNTIYNNIQACDNTFDIQIGKFVSPKIFMKVNGDCYPCEVFNLNKYMYLGNFFKDGIERIIENYNNNKYILFINKYKTEGFIDVIPDTILKENFCENSCTACEFCIAFCQSHNLLNINGGNDGTTN